MKVCVCIWPFLSFLFIGEQLSKISSDVHKSSVRVGKRQATPPPLFLYVRFYGSSHPRLLTCHLWLLLSCDGRVDQRHPQHDLPVSLQKFAEHQCTWERNRASKHLHVPETHASRQLVPFPGNLRVLENSSFRETNKQKPTFL